MINVVEFGELLIAIEDINQLEDMRYNFVGVVQCQQCQCNPLETQEICQCNDRKATDCMDYFWLLIFFLDFLQVQFRQHVKIVGQLNDEEELVQENHRMFRELIP